MSADGMLIPRLHKDLFVSGHRYNDTAKIKQQTKMTAA
jgi:hypothetical protein